MTKPQRKNFAPLPEKLPVTLDGSVVGQEGIIVGKIVALECYEGKPVTAMFHASETGGTIHDIPLDRFGIAPEIGFVRDGTSGCLGVSDIGVPVVEDCPLIGIDAQCVIFSQDREKIGEGESLYILHFPEGNTLFHLVRAGERLLLWPPHKLLFGRLDCDTLPPWKKVRI